MEIIIIINVALIRYTSRLMYEIYLYLDYFHVKFKSKYFLRTKIHYIDNTYKWFIIFIIKTKTIISMHFCVV